jgi:ubiquitin-conjugating enzyme E2 variant
MKIDLPKIPVKRSRSLFKRLFSKSQAPATSEFPLRFADIIWVALAIGLAVAHVTRLISVPGIFNWYSLLAVIVALPVADFISGCIHWTFDTWGSEKVFFIGPRLIKPFRVHHAKPKDLLGTHYFTTLADSAVAMIPVLLVALLIPLSTLAGQIAAVFLAGLSIAFLPTNQIHKWAHMDRPPLVVRVLQKCRLILPPAHHDVHHGPPHTDNYCITTGWCNPLLSRIGFFRKMEWLITKVTGMKPRHVHSCDEAGH